MNCSTDFGILHHILEEEVAAAPSLLQLLDDIAQLDDDDANVQFPNKGKHVEENPENPEEVEAENFPNEEIGQLGQGLEARQRVEASLPGNNDCSEVVCTIADGIDLVLDMIETKLSMEGSNLTEANRLALNSAASAIRSAIAAKEDDESIKERIVAAKELMAAI